ncbi:helix-turn-helix domain-containing protein [Brevibacillus brevis]|uniref:Helix-turn-helix transcriptional regulator n=1 Tax=Brevibacillus brevis TaxID=1393 RepID=A0A517IGH4_BREBE|nr:helix-turn-helix transcriptional regulator [Brevibacillus brevis]QDS37995.1 helix-turn-helix transcriptional regulator [Brevibacillus brevis]
MSDFGRQLGQALQEAGMTQLAFGFEANVSREAVSSYTTGRAMTPPDVKSKAVQVTNNPFLSIAAAYESSAGTSPVILDGDNVELNRHTVVAKTVEEVEELLEAIKEARPLLVKPPRSLTSQELQQIEHLIQETLDVVTSTTHMAAVITKESKLGWIAQWTKHKTKLLSRGFIKVMKGA